MSGVSFLRTDPGIALPKRWIAIASFVAAALCAGCSSTTTAPSSSVAVPHGWKTYAYGKAKVSVPSDWVVVTHYICPGLVAPGALYLGPPQVLGASCVPGPRIDSVSILPLPGDANVPTTPACTMTMNGLRVYVGPCTSSNPAGVIIYEIPP